MTGHLPESVLQRRDKLGFASPEIRWLVQLAPQVREWLGPGARVERYLRPAARPDLLRHSDEELARQPGLWRLTSVELWLRGLEGDRAA